MVRGLMKMFFVIVLFMAVPIGAYKHRSFAECENQSGMVYYDRVEKVCKCDNSQCYSRRNPLGVYVKEEECVHLHIYCDKGMQPDSTETQCVVCPEGTFKYDKGCEWCTPMTTCSGTEWTVFNGNSTTDRICTVTKPDTTVIYPQRHSNTKQNIIPETTTTQIVTIGVIIKRRGSTLSADFFYSFCGICGIILFAAMFGMFCAGVIKQLVQRTENDVERVEGRNDMDRKAKPWEITQTYIHQVDESKDTNGQIPIEDSMAVGRAHTVGQTLAIVHQVDESKDTNGQIPIEDSMAVGRAHTVGQTLAIDEDEVIPKVYQCIQNNVTNKECNSDGVTSFNECSTLNFSSLLKDRFTLDKQT
ncbi:uncharacterized protein LOC110445407 isoform X1 [Mizuhopecten yessoensis]|uniref:uncharacterized protein LOC110445407 isoform X1 n=1 Tax=Mizuhopecten yessoensis TaxID=6573 RepID=UPI000B45F009|nr:uncharacterized protein LOC110445407 isoform X1 [Mizuhopecten yessoensis]XP_021345677.1 uncharacterized protein LOC110445407 isoform X1 [Mizuhopecten yessoensis]